MFGVFMATESAAVAYTMFVPMAVYRQIGFKGILSVSKDSTGTLSRRVMFSLVVLVIDLCL